MAHPEFQLQKTLIEHLNLCGRGSFWFHPFNKASGPREGKMAKLMGVVAGVPDLVFFQGGTAWCLELKDIGGKLSPKQKETIKRILATGVDVEIAYGYKDALSILKRRGILR